MRNITIFLVLVIILISHTQIFANETFKHSLSLTSFSGLFYGHSEEIVYSSENDKYFSDMVSQLLWNIKNVFYYGLNMNFTTVNVYSQHGFLAELGFKIAIPAYSGIIEDRDWGSYYDNALTEYSRHDCYTDQIFHVNFHAGYLLPFKKIFSAKFYLAFSYLNFYFSGHEGSGYKAVKIPGQEGAFYPIEEIYTNKDFTGKGKVISYSQDWFVLSPGAAIEIIFIKQFFLELSLKISPLIACIALDYHITGNQQFKDYVKGGFYYEPGIKLLFAFQRYISISLNCSYREFMNTKGASYTRIVKNGNEFFYNGKAGAGLFLIDASLLLSFRI